MISVRNAISIPVLRKDFMVDPIQIVEARRLAPTRSSSSWPPSTTRSPSDLHATADALGMSVLLEAHDEAELVRALGLPSPLMGVNNRDLRTFTTDLGVTERLADMVPPGRLLISESGVAHDSRHHPAPGLRRHAGSSIGESLMRAENPVRIREVAGPGTVKAVPLRN